MWNRRNSLAAMVAAFIVALAAIAGCYGVANAAAAPAQQSPVQRLMGACVHAETFGIDSHSYICVQQAPREACRLALHVNTCWWYTGTRKQVLFDRAGNAVIA